MKIDLIEAIQIVNDYCNGEHSELFPAMFKVSPTLIEHLNTEFILNGTPTIHNFLRQSFYTIDKTDNIKTQVLTILNEEITIRLNNMGIRTCSRYIALFISKLQKSVNLETYHSLYYLYFEEFWEFITSYIPQITKEKFFTGCMLGHSKLVNFLEGVIKNISKEITGIDEYMFKQICHSSIHYYIKLCQQNFILLDFDEIDNIIDNYTRIREIEPTSDLITMQRHFYTLEEFNNKEELNTFIKLSYLGNLINLGAYEEYNKFMKIIVHNDLEMVTHCTNPNSSKELLDVAETYELLSVERYNLLKDIINH